MRLVINWVRFANGMPRFQEQSTRPQGTAVYDLDFIKIKLVVVFHRVLRQKRVLVTCEDGSFVFFCSGSQCCGCLTDVKFFTAFTIDFIHDTSWQVLIEFVLRFLQDRTVLTGLWATFTSNCPKVLAIFFKDSLKIGQSNKASVALWLIILGLILCSRWFGSWAAF